MKSLLSGFIVLLGLIFGFQVKAEPNEFEQQAPRMVDMRALKEVRIGSSGTLPHVDYTHKMGQWNAKDFENFVHTLPANTKMVQIYTYDPTGAYASSIYVNKNSKISSEIAAFLNFSETSRATRFFELRPDALPGYKLEPRFARYNPKYVPKSGEARVAQYQENGDIFVLLVESVNPVDQSITLVNGKVLKQGEYILDVAQVGKASAGVKVLHRTRFEHMAHPAKTIGTIHRVFEDGSIQLLSQRRVIRSSDYVLPEKVAFGIHSGMKIAYRPHVRSAMIDAEVAVVFKDYVLLSDGETVIGIDHILSLNSCEGLMVSRLDNVSLGK